MGGLQNNLQRVPPTQQVPARAIGLGGEVVSEVVLLVAGQKVARVDAKGIIALVADRLLLTKRHDRRDTVSKAVGRERLLLELDVGAGVVAEPKAPVAIRRNSRTPRLLSAGIVLSKTLPFLGFVPGLSAFSDGRFWIPVE